MDLFRIQGTAHIHVTLLPYVEKMLADFETAILIYRVVWTATNYGIFVILCIVIMSPVIMYM